MGQRVLLTNLYSDTLLDPVTLVSCKTVRGEDPKFFTSDPDPAQLEKQCRIRIRPKFDFIPHHFKLDFFILVYILFQDENNFKNP